MNTIQPATSAQAAVENRSATKPVRSDDRSVILARRKQFADEIGVVIAKHYEQGVDYIEVAAFLSHQAFAALDQVEPRNHDEHRAHRKLGDAHVLLGMEFPGWCVVEYSPDHARNSVGPRRRRISA